MNDEHAAPGVVQRADEVAHRAVIFAAVDADAVLDGDRNGDSILHGADAGGDEMWLGHQAGAKGAALHPFRRTATVQIDLVVARPLAHACGTSQLVGFAAAELQCDRMLGCIEAQMMRGVTVKERAGGHHLRVQARPRRELPVQVAAVPVGPVHHRRDAEAPLFGEGRRID